MSYCTKCGNELVPDASFCPLCGTPVPKETPVPPSVTPPTRTISSSFVDRMIRAARLDPTLYEEVERDETATTQALLVVIISSVCSGIGTAIFEALRGHGLGGITVGLVVGLVASLFSWALWSFITYFVGSTFFKGTSSYGELLRTIGFSNSPGILQLFNFLPIIGGLLNVIVWIWGLAAMVVAIRQAQDFSTGQAIITCIVGWILAVIVLVIVGTLIALPILFLGI